MKILLVEDHPSMRELLKVLLEGEGYQILEAKDGLEGVHLAKTERPDLMILDLMIPEIEGERVLQHIRETDDLAQMPVVIVSAKYEALDRCRAIVGSENVFSKPFEPTKLLDRIADLIGDSQKE